MGWKTRRLRDERQRPLERVASQSSFPDHTYLLNTDLLSRARGGQETIIFSEMHHQSRYLLERRSSFVIVVKTHTFSTPWWELGI